MGGLLAAGGAAAGGAYVGSSPYRRQAAGMLFGGPPDTTRKELLKALWAGGKNRFDPAGKGVDRATRIAGSRATTMKALEPQTYGRGGFGPLGAVLGQGKTKLPKMGPGMQTIGKLGKAGQGANLLSKMPWLSKILWPGMGWLIAGMLGVEGAKMGWDQLVTKPRERKEQDMLGAQGLGGAFRGYESQVEEQALADQLELIAETAGTAKPSPELAQILRAHDLGPMFQKRAPMPRPTFAQALDMVGGGQ